MSKGTKKAALHPQCIIGISDQYTRVTAGSHSHLTPDSVVLGILFGVQSSSLAVSLLDSIEVAYTTSSHAARKISNPEDEVMSDFNFRVACSAEEVVIDEDYLLEKIDLHQKNFPLQELIGWYRVGESEPAPSE
jgi:hypothetical protein